MNGSVRKNNLAAHKCHVVFALRIMGFPQESYTVRFNSEPNGYKSVSLSAKRSVLTLVGLGRRNCVFRIKYKGTVGSSKEKREPERERALLGTTVHNGGSRAAPSARTPHHHALFWLPTHNGGVAS